MSVGTVLFVLILYVMLVCGVIALTTDSDDTHAFIGWCTATVMTGFFALSVFFFMR